jgi:hypothetical protein
MAKARKKSKPAKARKAKKSVKVKNLKGKSMKAGMALGRRRLV